MNKYLLNNRIFKAQLLLILLVISNSCGHNNSELSSDNNTLDNDSKVDMILDFSFKDDFIESNYYDCRVVVRNFYPYLEYLRENNTVKDFRMFKKISVIAVFEAMLDDEL